MRITAPTTSDFEVTKKDFSHLVALIDADYLKYITVNRVYHRVSSGEKHSMAMVTNTINELINDNFFSRFSAKAYLFCFSAPSKNVFRNSIAQEKKYKGNRGNSIDITHYDQKFEDMAFVYEYINTRYPTLFFKDLEADDIVSFLQTDDTFIYSKDKDLKQVKGHHYNRKSNSLDYVDSETGIKRLVLQCLQGDSVDNFPGLKGFGEKSVDKFKEEHVIATGEEMYYHAVKLFTDKLGVLKGIDTFNEMWIMASMKIDRGDYFREKYALAYDTLKGLL
jgi:hypothetical protein